MSSVAPFFRFGVIGDPQYGDKVDAFVEGRNQRYREVPGKLQEAAEKLSTEDLTFVLVMGDLIDGQPTEEATQVDLVKITSCLAPLGSTPVYHVVGNHDVTPLDRSHFLRETKTCSSYYTKVLAPGWKLLVLDTTDRCLKSGYPEDSQQMKEARAYWESHPLSDSKPNMMEWNGGLSQEQMRWLDSELAAAEAAEEKLVVASHHPIGKDCARPTHMAWDFDILQSKLTSCISVVAVLHGHDHVGGHVCIDGVHFITMEAMLEAPEGSNSYAIVTIHEDKMVIDGVGTVTSRELALRK